MVQTKNPSPARKNPNSQRKFVLKRKSSSIAKSASQKSPVKNVPPSPVRSSPRKYVNPFKKLTPCKKPRLDNPSPRKLTLRSAEKKFLPSDSPKSSKVNLNNLGPIDFSSLTSLYASSSCSARKTLDFTAPKKELTEIPMDLRPGFKIKISSCKPFPWMKEAKAKSTSQIYIKNDDIVVGKRVILGMDLEADDKSALNFLTPLARLRASTCYYQYPDLTEMGLNMYPRLDSQRRSSLQEKPKPSLQQMGKQYVENLREKWKRTFEELYYDWRLSDRRSFYLFAHNTTILFTKYSNLNETNLDATCNDTIWAVNGKPKHRVIITPTTSGLRQILRDEGIKFELPLSGRNYNRRLSKNISFPCDDNTLAGLDIIPIDETKNGKKNIPTPVKKPLISDDLLESPGDNDDAMDHDAWLKEIGISPRTNLGFGRHPTISDFSVYSALTNNSPDDTSNAPFDNSINDASRSTAVISEPKSIQSFCNFLLVSKDFCSTTGSQAGLPPTIIASQIFENGAMKSLNLSSMIVKRARSTAHEYIIDIDNGPILPYMPSMLVSFIQSIPELHTQDNEVKFTISGRNPYLGFNECIDPEFFQNHSEFSYKPFVNKFYV